jgi:hypothetical protein
MARGTDKLGLAESLLLVEYKIKRWIIISIHWYYIKLSSLSLAVRSCASPECLIRYSNCP